MPTNRSACEFACGDRTGVLIARVPFPAKTPSNAAVNLLSRSRIRNLNCPARSPRSIIRLRACWAVQAPVGCAVTPRMCTVRVLISIANSTYTRWRSTVSTCRKSHARRTPLRGAASTDPAAQSGGGRDLPPQDRDLVPQHQDLRILGGVTARQQRQPPEPPDHEQVDKPNEHDRRA